jgi:hypothetical protein
VIPRDISLVPISRVVLDTEGRSVTAALVSVRFPAGQNVSRRVGDPIVTAADGRFVLTAMEGVSYTIRAGMPDKDGRMLGSPAVRVVTPARGAAPITLVIGQP